MGISGLRMEELLSRYRQYVGIGLYRIRVKRPSSGMAAFLVIRSIYPVAKLRLANSIHSHGYNKESGVQIQTISAYRNIYVSL
jgi:hypothetical protein